MDKVLLDTSAIFALINVRDDFHEKAVKIHDGLIRKKVVLILPNFLLAESHTIIYRRLGAEPAREFLAAALRDFDIERVTIEDEWSALAILQQSNRKIGVSYFDAVAVAMAERLGISEVFGFDRHFSLMGMNLLKA